MNRPTYEEAVRAAGRVLAVARAERDALSPQQAARAAWYLGHRLGSVEAIEALIISQREQALATREDQRAALPLAA